MNEEHGGGGAERTQASLSPPLEELLAAALKTLPKAALSSQTFSPYKIITCP